MSFSFLDFQSAPDLQEVRHFAADDALVSDCNGIGSQDRISRLLRLADMPTAAEDTQVERICRYVYESDSNETLTLYSNTISDI